MQTEMTLPVPDRRDGKYHECGHLVIVETGTGYICRACSTRVKPDRSYVQVQAPHGTYLKSM